MKETKTYEVLVRCNNCEVEEEIHIQKGSKVDEQKCRNCGTTGTIYRIESFSKDTPAM